MKSDRAVWVFTIAISLFTMPDLAVHDGVLGVHVHAILVLASPQPTMAEVAMAASIHEHRSSMPSLTFPTRAAGY